MKDSAAPVFNYPATPHFSYQIAERPDEDGETPGFFEPTPIEDVIADPSMIDPAQDYDLVEWYCDPTSEIVEYETAYPIWMANAGRDHEYWLVIVDPHSCIIGSTIDSPNGIAAVSAVLGLTGKVSRFL